MKILIKLLLTTVCVVNLASASFNLVNYQFDDANGANVHNAAVNNGSENASWNFNAGKVQNGNWNYGYTSSYKFNQVDANSSATTASRKLTFNSDIAVGGAGLGGQTQYSFEIDFSKWDLRRNWDSNDSAANKGIQITLDSTSGSGDSTAVVGFKTQANNGFHAFSQGNGSSFAQSFGSNFNTDGDDAAVSTLGKFEAEGAIMQINGDLSTGTWTSRAKTGEAGADWVNLGSGTGVTTINSIIIASKNPSQGSWGGAGAGTATDPTVSGTAGDYMMIDSITLTAVPEPSSYALIAGMLALASVMVRRRQ